MNVPKTAEDLIRGVLEHNKQKWISKSFKDHNIELFCSNQENNMVTITLIVLLDW